MYQGRILRLTLVQMPPTSKICTKSPKNLVPASIPSTPKANWPAKNQPHLSLAKAGSTQSTARSTLFATNLLITQGNTTQNTAQMTSVLRRLWTRSTKKATKPCKIRMLTNDSRFLCRRVSWGWWSWLTRLWLENIRSFHNSLFHRCSRSRFQESRVCKRILNREGVWLRIRVSCCCEGHEFGWWERGLEGFICW